MMMNSNEEILMRLAKIENRLDRHNQYIDSFCGSINDLVQKVEKLENKFKMRGDRLEDIEQAITNLESNTDNFYSSLKYLSASLDRKIDQDRLNSLESTLTKIQQDLKATQQIVKLLAVQQDDDY